MNSFGIRFLAGFAVVGLALLAGCSDEGDSAVADMGVDSGANNVGSDMNTGMPDMSDGDDMSSNNQGSDMSTDMRMDPPTSNFCETRGTQIREAGGDVINVSPGVAGRVMADGNETTLRQVVSGAAEGSTILLADGTYTFDEAPDGSFSGLYFTTNNVTLRGASGDATAVVLDSNYADHGGSTAPITIQASGITVADLTVKRSIFHLIHFSGGGTDSVVHNVVLEDGGQQFLKSSSGGLVENVEVSCSLFTMTESGRDNVWGYGATDGNTTCYTGGIDSHEGVNWTVVDNHFQGIFCDASGPERPVHSKKADQRGGMTYNNGGLAEHAIHMWDSPSGGHTIERNTIVDCARGIGVGFQAEVYGARIANNMIFSRHASAREHDVAISVERGHGTRILNNTVFYGSDQGYSNGIEIRWDVTSDTVVANNLMNRGVQLRNNAQATVSNNVDNAELSWFEDAETGNLRLVDCNVAGVSGGTDQGVATDIDGQARDHDVVGADACAP